MSSPAAVGIEAAIWMMLELLGTGAFVSMILSPVFGGFVVAVISRVFARGGREESVNDGHRASEGDVTTFQKDIVS